VIILFQTIKPENQIIFNHFILGECHGSELCFANIFAWKDDDELLIYYDEHLLIIKGRDFFFPPLVREVPYQIGIDFIQSYCKEHSFPFRIVGITTRFLPFFQILNTVLIRHPELDEYLYHATDLITYSGKKYHSKRNLLNQFLKIPHEFISYHSRLRTQIIDLVNLWESDVDDTHELKGILSLLDHIHIINCFCDCIIINEKCEAFAIGATLNNIGVVLFEKANTQFPGIYAAIAHMVANKHFQNMTYINRQEDMGLENLKKSKLSYHPFGYVEKWECTYDLMTQANQLYQMAFNDSDAYRTYFFNKKRKDYHYLLDNNTIKSMLFARKQLIHCHDVEYPSRLIFTLTTHPHYQHQGNMHRLLQKTFLEWFPEVAVVSLHPIIDGFYESLGFVPIDKIPFIPDHICLELTDDQPLIQTIYEEQTHHYDCYTVRTETDWNELFHELRLNNGHAYLLKNKDNIVGYALHDSEEFIEIITSISTSYIQNNLLRIVNLPLLLSLTPFVFEQTIQVTDPLIPMNQIIIPGLNNNIQIMSINELTVYIFQNKRCLILNRY